jgi:hypothetical protein
MLNGRGNGNSFTAGIYVGSHKLKDVDEILVEFVAEVKLLQSEGFVNGNRKHHMCTVNLISAVTGDLH